MSSPKAVIAFDVYGTLLDITSINRELQSRTNITPEQVKEVGNLWRQYQLEYTWRLNSMGIFQPFDEITRKSLVHALCEHGIEIDNVAVDDIIESYDSLSSYPDAGETLLKLRMQEDVRVVVFSNGTPEMIFTALEQSHLDELVDAIYDVGHVKKYKPATEAYKGLLTSLEHLQFGGEPEKCWLVSGNPFDVVGAREAGLNAIWIDRAGKGWLDRLGEGPSMIVKELGEVAQCVTKILQEQASESVGGGATAAKEAQRAQDTPGTTA